MFLTILEENDPKADSDLQRLTSKYYRRKKYTHISSGQNLSGNVLAHPLRLLINIICFKNFSFFWKILLHVGRNFGVCGDFVLNIDFAIFCYDFVIC